MRLPLLTSPEIQRDREGRGEGSIIEAGQFKLHRCQPGHFAIRGWAIAVLAGLFLPALNRARHKANGAVCLDNLKPLQLAWQWHTDDHCGEYPENDPESIGGVWRRSTNSWCPWRRG